MLSIDFILLHWPWLQLDGVHLVYLTCVASMKICVCNFLHDIPTSLEVLRVYSIISTYIQVVGERMHAVCKDSLESMVSENARNFLSWSRSCVFQISSMQYTLLARTVCICEHYKTKTVWSLWWYAFISMDGCFCQLFLSHLVLYNNHRIYYQQRTIDTVQGFESSARRENRGKYGIY